MKTQDIPHYMNFALLLSENAPEVPKFTASDIAARLIALAKRHKSLYIRICNEGELPNLMKRLKFIEESISILSAPYGKPMFGGDPRGYTVSLLFKSGDYNTLGGEEEGWGIPNY